MLTSKNVMRAIAVASLVVLAAAPAASAQAKPTVKIGYIPTDSFAALFLLADRHLPAAGINVETVRLAGGPEIVSQVATGQLQLGGAGMGAAGFNAVVSGLPVEYIAPLHSGYVEDYFVVRKALWGKEVKRIADLKGRTVALNIRGAAVEWMLDLALRRDGLTIKDVQVKLMPFPDMVPGARVGRRGRGHPVGALSDPRRGQGRRGAPADEGARRQARAHHRDLLEQGVGGGQPGPRATA